MSAPPILHQVVFIAGALFCLTSLLDPAIATPPIALALGIVLALLFRNPFRALARLVSKYLLQACVVMLGFSMDLPIILRAGARGAVMAALTIAATIALGFFLGRRLRIDSKTSALISSGTAICGGSAIAAVAAVIGAAEGQVAVAIGAVFILNAVALYIFPPIGHALELSQEQFGIWAGVAIHDVSSVVGAAARYGDEALQIATAVKLSRTLWIIPLSFAAAYAFRKASSSSTRTGGAEGQVRAKPGPGAGVRRTAPTIPYFIVLFLLASLARTLSPAIADAAPTLARLAKAGLTLTLFLIGAGISLATLKTVGIRALVQAVLLWLFISLVSLAAVMSVENPA